MGSAFLRRKGDRLAISRFKDKVICEPIRKILNKGQRNGGKFLTRFWACRGIVRFHCNKLTVIDNSKIKQQTFITKYNDTKYTCFKQKYYVLASELARRSRVENHPPLR